MTERILAIFFVFLCTASAWQFLAVSVRFRTMQQDSKLKQSVGNLWGTAQRQMSPTLFYKSGSIHTFPLDSSDIRVQLQLDYRRKGLLWYSTYHVGFNGNYAVTNPLDTPLEVYIDFAFPDRNAIYDDFRFILNGQEAGNVAIQTGQIQRSINLPARQSATFQITYRSHGIDEWWYDFGQGVTQARNFSLVVDTNFKELDFPENSISPTEKKQAANGFHLRWKYTNLLSGLKIGVVMPKKLNPGPWVARVIQSAPVSLFLYFFLLVIFSALRNIRLHPMNYFFIATSFFSFHLLLAYMADHVPLILAFAICSIVSLFLVVSYMRLVVGNRFAFVEMAISQLVYLVLFSYTFFFEEYTGLAITILCVLTLFVVMQMTGRMDWQRQFRDNTVPVPIAGEQVCPYCRGLIESSDCLNCVRCSVTHHIACWNQNKGCAIYGCSESRG